jgi:glycosyltransferase involved in cell wall biosynthesis
VTGSAVPAGAGDVPAGVVHAVLPAGVDDPARPSGGNVYDRRICAGLVDRARPVVEHPVPGPWPAPDRAALEGLDAALAACGDGDVVLVDGLVGCGAPEVLLRHRGRLRLVTLVHLPLGVASAAARRPERAMLRGCAGVVTTSGWTRAWLLDRYRLDGSRVHAVPPGVDAARPEHVVAGTSDGRELLAVGPVSLTKGHDLLVDALAAVGDLAWRCTCVGSLDVDAAFVGVVRQRLATAGLAGRVRLHGPVAPEAMGATYAAADLLVVPSRVETFGMVVTEAVAHGVPVVASDVGGVRESLAPGPGGRLPGVLVAPEDPSALAGALRCWLTDAGLREALRDAALARRLSLEGWDVATARLAAVLDLVGGPTGAPAGRSR